jgi:dipeptidyl aminopeptidase/acylaminoacyl peptidase
MKYLKLCFVATFFATSLFAQKKVIDFNTYKRWPKIVSQEISSNGKFVVYQISANGSDTLCITRTDTSWTYYIPNVEDANITSDSKKIIIKLQNDSLCVFDLERRDMNFIRVKSYQVISNAPDDFMLFRPADNLQSLVLRNFHSGKEMIFNDVINYQTNSSGHAILLQAKSKTDTSQTDLIWVSIEDGKRYTIFSGKGLNSNFSFDQSGNRLVFLNQSLSNKGISLFYYDRHTLPVKILMTDTVSVNNYACKITNEEYGYPRFSNDGNQILVAFKRDINKKTDQKQTTNHAVDVWNYKDDRLQSEQLVTPAPGNLIGCLSIESGKKTNGLVLLTDENERIVQMGNAFADSLAIITNDTGNGNEAYWRPSSRATYTLISLNTGKTKTIVTKVYRESSSIPACFSASGKFVLWFDPEKRNFFAYNVVSGITENITRKFQIPFFMSVEDSPEPRWFRVEGFTDDDFVYFYDQYDIWKVDLKGNVAAVNVTKGLGRKEKIRFNYLGFDGNFDVQPVIRENSQLLLGAFNSVNKFSGYYTVNSNGEYPPKKLSMGPYYGYSGPKKAANAQLYLVKQMSPANNDNLFITSDFIKFTQVSFLDAQKQYNWYTARLVKWRLPDGKSAEGILYKPENFDPKKKYPIIFHYYEGEDNNPYIFLNPDLSNGDLNIAWFVSHGYLVFYPFIHYRIGYPGESALNSVVSAAKFLAKFPWVDSTKMGLQGHSFGGFETNYIITKTNRFAAAASGAGLCDLVGKTFDLRYGVGESAEYVSENTQMRMGATLWQRPDLYIKNSPIYFADKVHTPLLIMHNKNDGAVPWSQGVEWFSALRRLTKPVWMLQYDGEKHSIYDETNQLDYSIRLAQFFDHYLKRAPEPKWMAEGIPANMKGIDSGLELESETKD